MYHVLIEADPYDCMGHRVKDCNFPNYEQAKEFYDSFFDKWNVRETAAELLFLPDFTDPEEDLLVLNTELTLLNCKENVLAMFQAYDGDLKYGVWYNDYNEIVTDACFNTYLKDAYVEKGATILHTAKTIYEIKKDTIAVDPLKTWDYGIIDDVNYIGRDGVLISYTKNDTEKKIKFDEVNEIWDYLTEDTFEGGRAYIWGEYIAFSALVASRQGGAFFLWNTVTEVFDHYSHCPYFTDAVWYSDDIYILSEVSNFVTPYHLEMWVVPFGTKDRTEDGHRVYCEEPKQYTSSSPWSCKLSITGRKMEVYIDGVPYLYTSDISSLKEKGQNPNFAHLYEEYKEPFDPRKHIMQGMIT